MTRQKLFSTLFLVGLVLMILAAVGFLTVSSRLFPQETLASDIQGAEWQPPTPTVTRTPTAAPPSKTPTSTPTPTPLPPTDTPTLTPTPRRQATHVVQPGETLFRIALRYGTTAEAILKINGIINPNAIRVGQELVIPASGDETTPATPSSTPTDIPTPTTTKKPAPVTPTSTATSEPKPVVTPTPLPPLRIEAEWSRRMEIARSDSIRISLIRTTNGQFVPTVEVNGHTAVADTPIPIGTLGSPAPDAFGQEYEAYAVARLQATAFDIIPSETTFRRLDQPRTTWYWNILPEKAGRQVINAHIVMRWEPINGEGEAFERTIWRSWLDVVVTESWIKLGQLNALSIVGGLIGSAFSVPWIYERITETIEGRQEEKRKEEETKPQS